MGLGKKICKHSAETVAAMWDEVGRRTHSEWECRARVQDELGVEEGQAFRPWDDPLTKRLVFEVERL